MIEVVLDEVCRFNRGWRRCHNWAVDAFLVERDSAVLYNILNFSSGPKSEDLVETSAASR